VPITEDLIEGTKVDAWYTLQGTDGHAGEVHLVTQLFGTPRASNSGNTLSLNGLSESPVTPRAKSDPPQPSPRRGSDGLIQTSSMRSLTSQGSGSLLVDPTVALQQLFNLEKEDPVKECSNMQHFPINPYIRLFLFPKRCWTRAIVCNKCCAVFLC
jgi:hypothetical protein